MTDDPAFDRERLHWRDTRRQITRAQIQRAGELDRMGDVVVVTARELERTTSDLEELADELVGFAMLRYGYPDRRWRLGGLLGRRVVELVDDALIRRDLRGRSGTEQAGRDRVALGIIRALEDLRRRRPTHDAGTVDDLERIVKRAAAIAAAAALSLDQPDET